MPYATTRDGARIYYEASGRGPAILAGSPFAATPAKFFPHAAAKYRDALASDYTIVLIDSIRGTGRSDRIYPAVFTPEIAATDLLAVADAAGIERFAWLGFSWSSVVGLQLALRTDRLTALLCGGWCPLDGPYRETGLIAEKIGRTLPFRLFRKVRDTTGMYTQIYDILAKWSVAEQRRQLATIQCPKLVFLGDRDNTQRPFRIALADRLFASEPELKALGWEVRWIPGATHAVVSRPARVLPVIRDFLDALRRQGALR